MHHYKQIIVDISLCINSIFILLLYFLQEMLDIFISTLICQFCLTLKWSQFKVKPIFVFLSIPALKGP